MIAAHSPETTAQSRQSEQKIRTQLLEVQRIVREKTGVELSPEQITTIHLLALEPATLARSIVFSITGQVVELAEPGDDGVEAQTGGN